MFILHKYFYFPATLVLLSVSAISGSIYGQEELLSKINIAQKSLNYSGIVAVEEYRSTSVYKVDQEIKNHTKNFKVERIGARTGDNTQVSALVTIQSQNSLDCKADLPQLCTSLVDFMQFNAELLKKNYTAFFNKVEYVAGIETQCLLLQPTDFVYTSFNLCIDIQSGLVLKAEIISKNNTVSKRLTYTWIEYNPSFEEDTFSSAEGFEFSGPPQDFDKYLNFKKFVSPKILFNWLPKGFIQSQKAPNMTSFDNGLMKFTVYVKPTDEQVEFTAREAGNLTVAQMFIPNKTSFDNISYKAVLVGEIDVASAQQILSNIKYK